MKTLICCFCGLLLTAVSLSAASIYADNFTYPDGPLIGQDSWIITGTSIVNPIMVSGGRVPLATTGQDVNAAFTPLTLGDTANLYIGATINVSASQATGDYFLHITPGPAGNTFDFFQRVFAKSTTGGYLLGFTEFSSGTTPVYGTNILNLNQDYRLVVAYNRVAGDFNDSTSLYVDPASANQWDNIAYLTKAWTSTRAETNIVATVNLRQGTATSAPTLTIDDLDVTQAFSEARIFTPVPEPSSLSLLGGMGLLALSVLRRRS